jgi:hypothetical protein
MLDFREQKNKLLLEFLLHRASFAQIIHFVNQTENLEVEFWPFAFSWYFRYVSLANIKLFYEMYEFYSDNKTSSNREILIEVLDKLKQSPKSSLICYLIWVGMSSMNNEFKWKIEEVLEMFHITPMSARNLSFTAIACYKQSQIGLVAAIEWCKYAAMGSESFYNILCQRKQIPISKEWILFGSIMTNYWYHLLDCRDMVCKYVPASSTASLSYQLPECYNRFIELNNISNGDIKKNDFEEWKNMLYLESSSFLAIESFNNIHNYVEICNSIANNPTGEYSKRVANFYSRPTLLTNMRQIDEKKKKHKKKDKPLKSGAAEPIKNIILETDKINAFFMISRCHASDQCALFVLSLLEKMMPYFSVFILGSKDFHMVLVNHFITNLSELRKIAKMVKNKLPYSYGSMMNENYYNNDIECFPLKLLKVDYGIRKIKFIKAKYQCESFDIMMNDLNGYIPPVPTDYQILATDYVTGLLDPVAISNNRISKNVPDIQRILAHTAFIKWFTVDKLQELLTITTTLQDEFRNLIGSNTYDNISMNKSQESLFEITASMISKSGLFNSENMNTHAIIKQFYEIWGKNTHQYHDIINKIGCLVLSFSNNKYASGIASNFKFQEFELMMNQHIDIIVSNAKKLNLNQVPLLKPLLVLLLMQTINFDKQFMNNIKSLPCKQHIIFPTDYINDFCVPANFYLNIMDKALKIMKLSPLYCSVFGIAESLGVKFVPIGSPDGMGVEINAFWSLVRKVFKKFSGDVVFSENGLVRKHSSKYSNDVMYPSRSSVFRFLPDFGNISKAENETTYIRNCAPELNMRIVNRFPFDPNWKFRKNIEIDEDGNEYEELSIPNMNLAFERKRHLVNTEKMRRGKCKDCGIKVIYGGPNDNTVIFDFDHIDRSKKICEVSKMVTGSQTEDVLINEMGGCDLRDSNCHRLKTHRCNDYVPVHRDNHDS